MYARRRRTVVLACLLIAAVVLLVSQVTDDVQPAAVSPAAPGAAGQPAGSVAARSGAKPTPASTGAGFGLTDDAPKAEPTAAEPATTGPAAGGGPAPRIAPAPGRTRIVTPAKAAFDFAGTSGPMLGTAGSLRRFKIAVESGRGPTGGDFANAVDRILGDPRSWIAGRQFRLQRVPRRSAAEFTVFLASAATSQRMCAAGGLQTSGYTSCRLRGQVIINLDRWENAVPEYGAPLATYQAYAINHEVGHQLGHGHEACPGAGRPAPVMQQQTYGLKGCTANAWPYVDGKRYTGPPTA